MHICIYIFMHIYTHTHIILVLDCPCYGVATFSKLPKWYGVFCKRTLQKWGAFSDEIHLYMYIYIYIYRYIHIYIYTCNMYIAPCKIGATFQIKSNNLGSSTITYRWHPIRSLDGNFCRISCPWCAVPLGSVCVRVRAHVLVGCVRLGGCVWTSAHGGQRCRIRISLAYLAIELRKGGGRGWGEQDQHALWASSMMRMMIMIIKS